MFSMVIQAIKNAINNRLNRWLSQRIPSKFHHKLTNRNIFIMPTRFGFAYLFFDFIVFLLGTNYQNNIILLFSYFLASLFITVMLHSFYNFSQLSISSNASQTGFANQIINFPISITGNKTHYDINFQFSDALYNLPPVKLTECNSETITILLPLHAKKRGVYKLSRVKVFSEYSLGLFITWSLLDFSHQAIVFPQPKKFTTNKKLLCEDDNNANDDSLYSYDIEGSDDYFELKNYVLGESPSRIAWKQFARGQGKLSKSYQTQQGSLHWLKLSEMPSNDIELKLQFLCFLIIEFTRNKQSFGLSLDLPYKNNGEVNIGPNLGLAHQKSCLIALANIEPQ